jgi:hypothetical protein
MSGVTCWESPDRREAVCSLTGMRARSDNWGHCALDYACKGHSHWPPVCAREVGPVPNPWSSSARISDAPAAAELAPGEYIECYDGEKWVRCKHKRRNPNSLSEICGHYHSRWAKEPAAPPVAERAPPKCEVRHPDVVSCTTDVLSRVYPVGRRYACSSCYRARESDIAIHMQGTMGGRHYQEPLPTDHWRAPDLLARPWLYRGRGR